MWIPFSRTLFLLLHSHLLHYTNCAIRANRPIRVLTTRSLSRFVVSPSLLMPQPLTRCSAVSSRLSAMLRDADPSSFSAVYVVCGYTDMRYGMDTLAAIIETRYHLPLFVPNTLFLFCGRRPSLRSSMSLSSSLMILKNLKCPRSSSLPIPESPRLSGKKISKVFLSVSMNTN